MNKLISTLLLVCWLVFTTACTTIKPDYGPQPNQYGHADFDRSPTHTTGDRYEDALGAYGDKATALPTQASMEFSWWLIPPNDRRPEAVRFDCEMVIRDAFAIDEIVHECDRVEKNGNDYTVYFVLDDVTRRINITAMKGGFTKGGFYEQGFAGFKYGNNRRVEYQIIWATHDPIRGRYYWDLFQKKNSE